MRIDNKLNFMRTLSWAIPVKDPNHPLDQYKFITLEINIQDIRFGY